MEYFFCRGSAAGPPAKRVCGRGSRASSLGGCLGTPRGRGERARRGESARRSGRGGPPPSQPTGAPRGKTRPPRPQTPAGAFPPKGLRTRSAVSAETATVHRQPRPTHAGLDGAPLPGPPEGARRRRERGGAGGRAYGGGGRRFVWGGTLAGPHALTRQHDTPRPGRSRRLHLGGRRLESLRLPQPRKRAGAFPIDGKATLRQA